MESTRSESRHVGIHIDRSPQEVYDFASDPAHLPAWAHGLGNGIEEIDEQWVVESPMGRIVVAFAEKNAFGVLDHEVTVPSGESFYNPMRVTMDGSGCEVVFTVRRQPEMSDQEFERDAGLVLADLVTLKQIMEQ